MVLHTMSELLVNPIQIENQGRGPAAYHIMIDDIPEGERPRERFLQVGASGTSVRELLAILLRIGPTGVGVLALADELLRRFGGLGGLARANINDLQQVHGIGPVKAMVRSLDQAKLWAFIKPLLNSPLHSIRPELLEFAQRNGVAL